ncbi:hypothetical protein ES703_09935 [subsurface metagenome]
MLFLIFSLIVCTTTPTDIIEHLTKSVFAPSNTPMRVTRTHLNPQEDEIFKEYIYKQGYKMRIDVDFGDSTITTFVYNGKRGFNRGGALSKIGSLEMVLFGRRCGYLGTMEKISFPSYEARDNLLATGRQGNKLYLDYRTYLPIRFEWINKVVLFEEYKTIDGLGDIPSLIVESSIDGVDEIIRITDVDIHVIIPANFFSVPKQRWKEALE